MNRILCCDRLLERALRLCFTLLAVSCKKALFCSLINLLMTKLIRLRYSLTPYRSINSPKEKKSINIPTYYMASSASGQDEPNRALWLATRAGKMEPSCPLGTTRCIPRAKFPQKPYNKSFIDQVCSVKMAGYWPRSFFASLWTSTSSRSINTQKKNLANIQPSWPHAWSITHTSWPN